MPSTTRARGTSGRVGTRNAGIFRGREESSAQVPPERVPARDVLLALGAEGLDVDRAVLLRVRGPQPLGQVLRRYLRMELDAPGRPCPEALQAPVVAGERDSAVGELEVVAVPLKCLEGIGQTTRTLDPPQPRA